MRLLSRVLFIFLLLCTPAAAQLTLLTMEPGVVGQSTSTAYHGSYPMTGYGTYTGTEPTSATGTWTSLRGGESATILRGLGEILTTIAKRTGGASGATGTYTVAVTAPTTAGTGCTLTITTNISTTATSPPTTVFAYPSGGTITSNIHNAPGWLHSHAYAPQTAAITFTNGSANIAWTNGINVAENAGLFYGNNGESPRRKLFR